MDLHEGRIVKYKDLQEDINDRRICERIIAKKLASPLRLSSVSVETNHKTRSYWGKSFHWARQLSKNDFRYLWHILVWAELVQANFAPLLHQWIIDHWTRRIQSHIPTVSVQIAALSGEWLLEALRKCCLKSRRRHIGSIFSALVEYCAYALRQERSLGPKDVSAHESYTQQP